MNDRDALALLEGLTRYGGDYPEEVVADITVSQLTRRLIDSLGPNHPVIENAVLKAQTVWGESS